MPGRGDAPVLTVAAGAAAVICCAGLPAITAVVGGITIAAVLGVAGGVLVVAGVASAAVLVARSHRRPRASGTSSRRSGP